MKTIKQILVDHLNENRQDLQEHETIKAALTPHDGKEFNGRLQRYLPEGYKIVIEYSLLHIKSPSGRTHHLGWTSNPFVNIANMDNINASYCTGAKERIEKIEGFLNDPIRMKQLTSMFMKVKKAWAAFKTVANELEASKMDSYHNPAYYDLLKNFDVPYRIISDIRFNKIIID